MRWSRSAAILALVLAPVFPGIAQDTPEPSPPPAEERPEQADEGGERPSAPARDDSPYDYQSSEEISEDLSVSFPVDI